MIVVDTNVIRELMNPESPRVLAWVGAQRAELIHTTTISLAETLYGIERLPAGGRRERLRERAEALFGRLAERILPFDSAAAEEYALVRTDRELGGRPIGEADCQIAAICRVYGATIATRNVRHFEGTGIDVVDPWQT